MGRIIIIVLIFITLLILGYKKANSDVYGQKNEKVEILEDFHDLEQDKILDCLQKLENYDHLTKWYDINSYTYGDYALKLETIQDLFQGIDSKQAEAIATTPSKAREIARYILFVKKQTSRYGYATNPKSTIGKMFDGKCEEKINLDLLK